MSRFYKLKKLDRAHNEWSEAKRLAYSLTMKEDESAVCKALSGIGRWGYKAAKGIDCLDVLIGTENTEMICEKAVALKNIKKELRDI